MADRRAGPRQGPHMRSSSGRQAVAQPQRGWHLAQEAQLVACLNTALLVPVVQARGGTGEMRSRQGASSV